MEKIILFRGGIETLEFFSMELSKYFLGQGVPVFVFDLLQEEESFRKLQDFCQSGELAMITFNFTGIRGEEIFYSQSHGLFWDRKQIACINIVVDHPFYYDALLEIAPERYYQVSIDRFHEAYMKRLYPHIKLLPFLPLGGTAIRPDPVPLQRRPMDIVFTGNYTTPATFNPHIERINQEYTDFYHGIIDDLTAHPNLPMEQAMEAHLTREMGALSIQELRKAMANMIFIDLYVRFYFRGLAVKTLAEAGIPVHVYGTGWEKLDCARKENIISGGPLTSLQCLEAISQGKISLNVMPWFKDGAHDRIFNSQLNGAVSLTDGSIYLKEQLSDLRDCAFYSLESISALPQLAKQLLSSPEKMEAISKCGFQSASASHKWAKRAESLLFYMQNLL